jgi:hypothetical protein
LPPLVNQDDEPIETRVHQLLTPWYMPNFINYTCYSPLTIWWWSRELNFNRKGW